ncbi:MAG: hypothetical protein ACI9EW_001179 [Cellvibrionaceae bacterium]|jgi:hypothetical protein
MSDQNQSKDTGRDCPYCGGVIYRVEDESSKVKTVFHSCKMCGAKWSDGWSLTSSGNRSVSKDAAQSRGKSDIRQSSPSFDWQSINIPTWGWIIIVLVGAFILVRLGALAFLNVLLVPLTIAILGYIIFRTGKDQGWW